MKLTNNFYLNEFLKSRTAKKFDFEDQFNPPTDIVNNLKKLCENILQPLSDSVDNEPIMITSGYRSPQLNSKIGGSSTSEHCYGMAADIQYYRNSKEENRIIFDYIIQLDLPFGQLIYEFGDEESPDWVHVSYNENRIRKQILKAYKENGRTKYDDITNTYKVKHILPTKKENKTEEINKTSKQYDKVLDIIKSFKDINSNSIKEVDFNELAYKIIKYW